MTTHFEQDIDHLKQKLVSMAGDAAKAAGQAVKALADRDDLLAERVKEQDQVLDRHEMQVDEAAMDLLIKAPLAGHLRFIAVALKISHELERIADHATNVAEDVVYLCEALDIRHKHRTPNIQPPTSNEIRGSRLDVGSPMSDVLRDTTQGEKPSTVAVQSRFSGEQNVVSLD